jgi:regulatory protein
MLFGMRSNPRQLDVEGLWQYGLRVLGMRGYAVAELRDKLARRAARAEDVATILARLKQYGYLDDRRYAENYAASRLANESLGRFRVVQDLRKRRVAPAVVEAVVGEVYSGSDEDRLAEEFLRRKLRKVDPVAYLAEPKHVASAYRKLRLAGFGYSPSLRVIKKFAREPELLDQIEDSNDGGGIA